MNIEEIPLNLIDESPTNPRTRWGDLDALASEIRALGVQVPIKVRRGEVGRYEIVFGARRTRASRMASRATIPAIVVEMDPREVLLAQIAENHHEPLTPLDEGTAYRRLRDEHRLSVGEIALRAGVSESTVRSRIDLTELRAELRALLDAGRITMTTAMRFAAHSTEVQEQIAADIDRIGRHEDVLSKDTVSQLLARHVRRLALAPFDIDSESLSTSAGPCGRCPHNTATQRALFDEDGGEALCMKATCWSEKLDAAWQAEVESASSNGIRVLTSDEAALALFGRKVREGSGWVDVDSPISIESPMTWRQLEVELAEADKDGQGFDLGKLAYARNEEAIFHLLDAKYAAGFIAKSYPDDAASLLGQPSAATVEAKEAKKVEREEAAKLAELHAEAMRRLVQAVIDDEGNRSVLHHLVLMALHIVGASTVKAVALRRELPLEESDGRSISPLDAVSRLASVLHEEDAHNDSLFGILLDLIATRSLTDPSLPSSPIESLLKVYDINLAKLRKEMARAKRNVRTRGRKGASAEAAE